MKRKTCVAVVVLMSVIGAAVARTDSAAGPPAAAANSAAGPPAAAANSATPIPVGAPEGAIRVTPREELSPMHREIFDAIEAERAQVEALSDRFALALLPGQKLEIQKDIEAVKKAGMIRVFEIQLRYARVAGRDEVVRQLETAIQAMKTPGIPKGPGPTVLEKAMKAGR